jgi:Ni,Fe-hydrogenase III small subunit
MCAKKYDSNIRGTFMGLGEKELLMKISQCKLLIDRCEEISGELFTMCNLMDWEVEGDPPHPKTILMGLENAICKYRIELAKARGE